MVDRNQGTSVHKQRVQPEESVIVTGVYVHVLQFSDLYCQGFFGWYLVHESAFEFFKTDRTAHGDPFQGNLAPTINPER
eukprot:3321937-Karenia_brevis.AAC.1